MVKMKMNFFSLHTYPHVEPNVWVGLPEDMDEEGNVVNHAEVTVDGVDAVLLDVDNNGSIDVAIVDSDGDGQVTIEDAMDMSDTGLTMDDVAQHMMGQDDQMPDDNMI